MRWSMLCVRSSTRPATARSLRHGREVQRVAQPQPLTAVAVRLDVQRGNESVLPVAIGVGKVTTLTR